MSKFCCLEGATKHLGSKLHTLRPITARSLQASCRHPTEDLYDERGLNWEPSNKNSDTLRSGFRWILLTLFRGTACSSPAACVNSYKAVCPCSTAYFMEPGIGQASLATAGGFMKWHSLVRQTCFMKTVDGRWLDCLTPITSFHVISKSRSNAIS